jgi:hypothetical protein
MISIGTTPDQGQPIAWSYSAVANDGVTEVIGLNIDVFRYYETGTLRMVHVQGSLALPAIGGALLAGTYDCASLPADGTMYLAVHMVDDQNQTVTYQAPWPETTTEGDIVLHENCTYEVAQPVEMNQSVAHGGFQSSSLGSYFDEQYHQLSVTAQFGAN